MDAGEQKILQDAVAALQRNDPALKKQLELSELRACSWPARALRLFLGAVVTVALTGHGAWKCFAVTPFIWQKMKKEVICPTLVPPAARRYAALSSGTRMWLTGRTSVRGSNRAVLFLCS
jgi:hypothetical protein